MSKTSAPRPPRHQTRLAQILDLEGRKMIWLAERVGVDNSQVSRWAAGLHVPDDKRELIASALGRTETDVFGPVLDEEPVSAQAA